jgi:hypothetical protein
VPLTTVIPPYPNKCPFRCDVLNMLQQDSQTWERLLWTSGGLLNISKCLFYILAWCFDSKGRATMVPATDIHPSLRLTSGNDPNRAAINHFNYDTAHTYLGDSLTPNLQMRTGDAALMKTGLNFSRRLVSSSLSKHDVWIAYFVVFQPAMTYTFPVTHHSATRLHKIQSAPTRSTLVKLGFNCNTAHAVAFGPSRYGGLGLRNLQVEQGIAGIIILIRHLRARTQQGLLLLITLAWWQQIIGTQAQILEYPNSLIPHNTPHLLSAQCTFLTGINGSLHIAELQGTVPPPIWNDDVCLMEAVLTSANQKPAAVAAFNRARLHFGVMFLSEIATADGRALARDA